MSRDYCVAIRTLGTAGEKYQILLQSLAKQTIQPKRILVYLAEGYAYPKETIGLEEIIYCSKGMVSQRALPYKEIDTDYILFCDDDIVLEPDSVERLFLALEAHEADCVSPDTYPNHRMDFIGKIKKAIFAYTFPHFDKEWSFKVLNCGTYSYNIHPNKDFLMTQSGAGPCCLCKKKAYLRIHFEDERWMDSFGYALGEDMLFFYKLYVYGYKVLTHFNSGIKHLSAETGNPINRKKWFRKGVALSYILPYRIKYNLKMQTPMNKVYVGFSMYLMFLEQLLVLPFKMIKHKHYSALIEYYKGLCDGMRYVRTEEFKGIPLFDGHK